ncbi:GntR family transcriptional regulator, partial [Mycobacterium sp. ITM-2017-0098]
YAGPPLYRQLSDLLETRLVEHSNPGDKLPSEAELSQEFEVNRLTVRRALDELNQRGLIETVHGKGSFVAFPQ